MDGGCLTATTSGAGTAHGDIAGTLAGLVLDRFVHGQDQARRLRGRREHVGLDQSRFPHERLKVIGDILIVHIHTAPDAAYKQLVVVVVVVSVTTTTPI